MSKEFIAELREAAASFFKGDGGLRDTLEKAADALESTPADQQRIETAADNCEVLRARLARYEDAGGNPLAGVGADERAAFEAWYLGHFYMGDKQCGLEWLSTEPCGGYRHQHPAEQWIVWQARAALSAPDHSEQVRQMVPQLPAFAQKVISKLKRFEECTDDGQGADIGRHWFDLLTQLGLLNRVQRSPGLWEITAQGEDVLAAPSACSCGEPDAAGTHRKDGPCHWGPSAPSAGSQGGDV